MLFGVNQILACTLGVFTHTFAWELFVVVAWLLPVPIRVTCDFLYFTNHIHSMSVAE